MPSWAQGLPSRRSWAPSPPASERLESWKEIANYLKRGVRTVQRWEREEGLPVHRHMHDKLGTVYGFRAEIDAWWANGRSRLEAEAEPEQASRPGWRRLRWATAAAATVLLAAGAWWFLRPQAPALPFEARDWVLIAAFENRTGEPVFDRVIEHALQRELSNSRFVSVVPRERVNDALVLMRRPLETRVDAALGRELCLRDGGIRALVAGRVEKLDNTYLLSARLVSPADGVTVASFSEGAAGQNAVVPALRRLSSRVRRSLGEELSAIRRSEQKLEKVTTPSLRALQLFSHADTLFVQGNYEWVKPGTRSATAEELLKQAVTEDPQFASAYTHLAWAISRQGRPESDYRPYAERAVELAESASERERYFILGSYYQQLGGQDERAIPQYEALLRLYPDHFWGTNNMVWALRRLGRHDEALPYLIARAESRPNDFVSAAEAWSELADSRKDPARARHFLEQARRLAPSGRDRAPELWVTVQFVPLDELLVRGELPQAVSELERLKGFTNELRGQTRVSWLFSLGSGYELIARLQAAQKYYEMLPENLRHWPLAWLAEFRGDRAGMLLHVRKDLAIGRLLGPATAARLARAGLHSESQEAISRLAKRGARPHDLQYARGELALAQGRTEEALALLRSAYEAALQHREWRMLAIAEAYARALERKGDLPTAIRVMEQGWDLRPGWRLYSNTVPHKNQLRLLYRKAGRVMEAQKIEAQLRKLLAYADEDHPVLRDLKREGAADSAAKH